MRRYFWLMLAMVTCLAVVRADGPTEFSPAIDAAQPKLVKIYGGTIGRSPGYATGLIVSPQGEIVTAYGAHLSTPALRIVLPSGETHYGRVERSDTVMQVALLKIDAETPAYFKLGETAEVEAGDWVLALSNAFKVAEGSEPLSVSLGVFTSRTKLDARRGMQDFPYAGDVLLYDAITANPGAAGGAVINARGELLGMIGKVTESKQTNTRLNYAVPTEALDLFLKNEQSAELVKTPPPSTSRQAAGELGLRLFSLGGRRAPAFIDRVLPGSPAAAAGIRSDDLVVSVDGKPIRNAEDFTRLSTSVVEGQRVVVEIKRKNEVLSFTLVAGKK